MRTILLTGFAGTLLFSACTDTLVYGERTGLNIAIRTDAPQGHPLEVNTGLQRRVVGHVPPRNSNGGEAITMLSSFNLKRTPADNNNPLQAKVAIETSFASGKAAKTAAGSTASVEAIFDRPGVTESPKLSDQQNGAKIRKWIMSDQDTARTKARKYLDFLGNNGGKIDDKGNDLASADSAISDGQNAALNKKFIEITKF